MRSMRVFRFLTLFAAAAAALCQSEDEPYFSLMSQHTYASHGVIPLRAPGTWTHSISASTA